MIGCGVACGRVSVFNGEEVLVVFRMWRGQVSDKGFSHVRVSDVSESFSSTFRERCGFLDPEGLWSYHCGMFGSWTKGAGDVNGQGSGGLWVPRRIGHVRDFQERFCKIVVLFEFFLTMHEIWWECGFLLGPRARVLEK